IRVDGGTATVPAAHVGHDPFRPGALRQGPPSPQRRRPVVRQGPGPVLGDLRAPYRGARAGDRDPGARFRAGRRRRLDDRLRAPGGVLREQRRHVPRPQRRRLRRRRRPRPARGHPLRHRHGPDRVGDGQGAGLAAVTGRYAMLASVIRTVVPYIVGVIVGQAARIGLDLDEGAVTALVTVVASYVYYQAARLLEERWPAAGRWLLALGLTRRAPQYVER